MTQASLAEKLGIGDRAVSKWETGKSMPDSGLMPELCDFQEINVNVASSVCTDLPADKSCHA